MRVTGRGSEAGARALSQGEWGPVKRRREFRGSGVGSRAIPMLPAVLRGSDLGSMKSPGSL